LAGYTDRRDHRGAGQRRHDTKNETSHLCSPWAGVHPPYIRKSLPRLAAGTRTRRGPIRRG
jgi:hypothetical protein